MTISRTTAIHVIFAVGLVVCLAAITFTLCYRVWVDGNNPISTAIAQNLTWLGMVGIIGLLGMFITIKIPFPPIPGLGTPTTIPTPSVPDAPPASATSTTVHVESLTKPMTP